MHIVTDIAVAAVLIFAARRAMRAAIGYKGIRLPETEAPRRSEDSVGRQGDQEDPRGEAQAPRSKEAPQAGRAIEGEPERRHLIGGAKGSDATDAMMGMMSGNGILTPIRPEA